MRFFTSFYVIVTAKLVFSSQCHEGYFSDEYKKCIDCPEHCQHCDSSKICLSCQDGYWGNICELPCSRCQPETSCEKTNGFCFVKCKDGYTGILCDAFCNDKCLNCDRMNAGMCDLCALGRYGESCDKRCPEFCYNNTCDNNGYCTYGCDSGYWGPKCGNNCSSNCKHSSCETQTGACIYGCKSTFLGSRCDIDIGNKGDENDEKAANDEEEGQTANDDKENEASRQGGETWSVILIVVLIVIVSVVVCVVYRKELINLRRRGLTWLVGVRYLEIGGTLGDASRHPNLIVNHGVKNAIRQRLAEPEAPIEIPLIQTRESTTSEDSGVCSQESPPTSLTHETVKLLQPDTALNTNNEPMNDELEKNFKIIIIPEFPADKIEADLGLTQGLLQQDKNATMEAPSIVGEKAASPSVENSTDITEVLIEKPQPQTPTESGNICQETQPASHTNDTVICASHITVVPPGLLDIRYVDDLSGTMAYIICKDPNDSTEELEFWELVWQQKCSIIVKLSRNVEETSENKYWPEKDEEAKTCGPFTVINVGVTLCDSYRERKFALNTMTDGREVVQMQFDKWPLDRFPHDKEILLEFRQKVNKFGREEGPLLVHCSDGHGRSNVYVALDMLLEDLEKQRCSDMDQLLNRMRTQALTITGEQCDFLRKTREAWKSFNLKAQQADVLKRPMQIKS